MLDMDDPLAVYLHDHLAGSSFAVELLEKLVSEYGGTPSGNIARELLEQVHIDRGTLQELIAKVGKASPDLYDALGWIAERISRIKLKHDDPTGSGTFEHLKRSVSAFLANVRYGRRCKPGRLSTPALPVLTTLL